MSVDFQFPGMPFNPSKRDVATAITVIVAKYRASKGVPSTQSLKHDDIDEIVEGVRHMVFQYEEIKPPRK